MKILSEEVARKIIKEITCIEDKDWDMEGAIDSLGMVELFTALEVAMGEDAKIDINLNPNDRELTVMKTPNAVISKLKELRYVV